MKAIILSLFLVVLTAPLFSQNSIIYGELGIGVRNAGFMSILGINYEKNENLFSIRHTGTKEITIETFAYIIPYPKKIGSKHEIALMYGKRFTQKFTSVSFSGGVSLNMDKKIEQIEDAKDNVVRTNYIGFPFEINFRLFNGKKRRPKLLFFIPIGKPTTVGGGIGLKLLGNISKKPYVGFGIVYSLGDHKIYDEP